MPNVTQSLQVLANSYVSVVDRNTPNMKTWKCQTTYTMWWGHYVIFLQTYSIRIHKHNCMPTHRLIQHPEHSTHEHLHWKCRLWMPLCNEANGYQHFREHKASILRVEIWNSSGPFPSDCNLFIRLHSSGALSFRCEMMRPCIAVVQKIWMHDSCLISLADYV
jgi:hypothetical protein